jgi:hypothetical protein
MVSLVPTSRSAAPTVDRYCVIRLKRIVKAPTRKLALIARGALLATAFWMGLYAWWMWQNQPTGVASAMYFWIRHFYGSLAICIVSLLCALFTLAGGRSGESAAG